MKKTITSIFLASLLSLSLANHCFAQTIAGSVKTLLGVATVQRGNESLSVKKEMPLYSKDVIETTASAFVGMVLIDGTKITAGANTKLNLANYEFNPETQKGVMKVNVVKGIIQVASGTLGKTSRENVQFNSPTASIGIRGTNFVIEVGSDDEDITNESTAKN